MCDAMVLKTVGDILKARHCFGRRFAQFMTGGVPRSDIGVPIPAMGLRMRVDNAW
jgi:hypothetical protein